MKALPNRPLILISIWASLALAPSAFSIDTYDKKDDVPVKSDMDYANDEAADVAKADKELNAVYKQLMGGLEDDIAKGKLRKSERAWIAFRDADAEFIADFSREGTAYPMEYQAVLLEMTQQRTKELKEQVHRHAIDVQTFKQKP
jgi:uncharacterized protein YecT (DUF1311 family)